MERTWHLVLAIVSAVATCYKEQGTEGLRTSMSAALVGAEYADPADCNRWWAFDCSLGQLGFQLLFCPFILI